jgi:predicted DsbA family dithiol-disulfide isomerase
MAETITATLYSDPGCPWAYSENPALAALRWRYPDGIDWRLVTIGLAESADRYEERGYTPGMMARGYARFRRYGMPFATAPRERVPATSRACRAIVATRLRRPELTVPVYRALQFGWFTSTLVLDRDADIAQALATVPGLDVPATVAAIDEPEVIAAYEADKHAARCAAGGPTEFQGKARDTDGEVRYSAPSLVFESGDGARFEAGGFQPVEAYDVLIANFASRPVRREPPAGPLEAVEAFDWPLATQEIAAIMAQGNDAPDRAGTEDALIELAASGSVRRIPLGDDALWASPPGGSGRGGRRPHRVAEAIGDRQPAVAAERAR